MAAMARRGPAPLDGLAGELQRSLAARAVRAAPAEHDPTFQLLERALDYLHDRGELGGAVRGRARHMRPARCGAGLPPPDAPANRPATTARSCRSAAPHGARAVCQPDNVAAAEGGGGRAVQRWTAEGSGACHAAAPAPCVL